MDKILFEQVPELFESVGNLFLEKKEELCEMDARLGDGDLGLTMSKGYAALPDLMRAEAEGAGGDIGKMLMKAGMKMSSLVPSTMGFLMSTGVMEGGKALKGRTELNGAALADYLTGFAAGIQKRGKCEPGQRTIYDSVLPAAQAAAKTAAENPGASLDEVITAAEEAAKAGVEATKDMVPVFGKAAVHAAACAGVPDQGAIAGYYKILGLSNYIKK
ncbi:MAG TPA: dihydroxyacetone kinase subunit L [Candidatus Scatomonas pullistercoris]|uniref:Dihydroxyacetone kinase subunit L n=1 Tax=Candidatus Scatomonas pullistercoris TaxID=2840920 RepID=A0A9D1P1K2_9FIRM|nr:dihydroxyacetone kinase subunit L [Candidatus Scatomonas pullistercoris]